MEQYIYLAEEKGAEDKGSEDKGGSTSDGSINFDKSKVFNNVDTSNKDKASDASLQNAFNTAFIWAGIICVIVIVVAGLTFITSSGNPSRISKAKSAITYASFGIGIIVSAALIVNLIISGLLKGSI